MNLIAPLILAASVFTPQSTEVQLNPDTGAPKLELGVLSPPLQGELVDAVRTWAVSQRERYGLQAGAKLVSTDAFSTRFGASFHLAQEVDGLEVYQGKLVVTLDAKRQVVQVASSLQGYTRAVAGAAVTTDEALRRAGSSLPLVALRPDGVPYGGAKRFYFRVGDELHGGFIANVRSLDFTKNWYVAFDAVTGERLFVQNRVHHGALDAKVYPVSPGGLDAGVGATATVTRELRHADGGSMIGDTCVTPLDDGGMRVFANDAGELCGSQLMMFNCCPTKDCSNEPDAGLKRIDGMLSFMGLPVTYDVAVCERRRLASNVRNGTGDFVYTPVDPPTDKVNVVGSDPANSDPFAEVHSFYHVNTVYDWMRRLSATATPIYAGNPSIQPFQMRDERRMPAVKVAVWSNVMFPNFNELFANPTCVINPPCRANTLLRIDNAAFFPRENFSQLPLPGFDTGADTLMIFQGNAADAAYDATVIQHEFGHGAVYATANLTFEDVALDNRSANNEGGALHEGFADYIAAAFNNLAEVGPYFGPRALAGQPMAPGVATDSYLRSMDNTLRCPDVLWGEVHQDSQHVAGALWQARKTLFLGTDNGETYDAAFYAMLVSITPNADFAMVASTMAARVATAFPGVAMAGQRLTQIFQDRGVIGCSKVVTASATTLPRPYYGIASASAALGNSLIPGPFQIKIPAAAGASKVTVTGVVGGNALGGQPPQLRVLARVGDPINFARQGGTLQNNAEFTANAATQGQNVTANVTLTAACNSDIYVTIAAPGGGATLQNVDVQVTPLVNCMLPVDGGTGGGGGGGGGSTGGGGGSTGTTTLPSVGANNQTQQAEAKVGCGCATPADLGAPLMALVLMLGARRRRS
ncbi:MAG: hypothetical protein ACOZQL_33605 [Myxococcota bacterium]